MEKENRNVEVSFPKFVVGDDKLVDNGNGSPAPRHSVRFLYGIWARTSAFTLIELLVVVLIIGILAAVALPQYKVAVAKSRFVQLQVIADGLKKAESVYFMTNGKYTQDFSELDISPELNTAGNVAKAGEASCYANEDGMFYCFYGGGFAGTSPVPVYVSSWGQERAHCRAYAGFQNKVCKSLSKENKNCEPSADSYCAYRL